jgi:hypothetical protein
MCYVLVSYPNLNPFLTTSTLSPLFSSAPSPLLPFFSRFFLTLSPFFFAASSSLRFPSSPLLPYVSLLPCFLCKSGIGLCVMCCYRTLTLFLLPHPFPPSSFLHFVSLLLRRVFLTSFPLFPASSLRLLSSPLLKW